MEEQIKINLRRQEHTLTIIGLGVILFGFWSMIRAAIEYMLDSSMLQSSFDEFMSTLDPAYRESITDFKAGILFLFASLLILSVEMGFRLYIGRSAMAVGKGKNKSILYLVAASVLCIIYILSFISYALALFISSSEDVSLFDKLVYIVIDLTSIITLADMIIAGIRVRRLRKKLSRIN